MNWLRANETPGFGETLPAKILDVAVLGVMMAGVIALADWLLRLPLWRRRSARSSLAATAAQVDRAKEVLTGRVIEQWRTETALWSIEEPASISVSWRSTGRKELMDHPRLVTGGAPTFEGPSEDVAVLADGFRALRCRRLVILGEPGTGKTVLATRLLLEFAKTRRPEDPVPVLLSAARWDVDKHSELHEWLRSCLASDYPALCAEELGPNLPRALATRGEVLPVLDGLDELPTKARSRILLALNRSMSESGQLIVTCRTAQFAESVRESGEVLTAAAVIEPLPLSPDVAADYLETCLHFNLGKVWTAVLEGLRRGDLPALAAVASTPLGLWQIRVTYIDFPGAPPPDTLLELGRAEAFRLNENLCDCFIPALIDSRPPVNGAAPLSRPHRAWEAWQVRLWLTYLSHELEVAGEGGGGVAWWRLARHVPTSAARWGVSLGCGLLVGLLVNFLVDSKKEFLARPAVVAGLLSTVVARIMIESWFRESPGYANFHFRGRGGLLVRYLMEGVLVGFMGALVGAASSSESKFASALLAGLASGLGFELVFGLARWSEHPTPTSAARSPWSTWRADRNLTLLRTFSGFAVGLMGGVIGWRVAHLDAARALTTGALVGLLFGVMVGNHHAWLAYNLMAPRLAADKWRLPLRTMAFLEDAYRLGLLRTEGPVYQFRNAELQRYLLDRHPDLIVAHEWERSSRRGDRERPGQRP
ncbi:NACHT domain-containing protein [Streptosporangium carneum]|nr:NACHT domain-containing protein [Streptosporangium carneum]